jgi:hypothetical protein
MDFLIENIDELKQTIDSINLSFFNNEIYRFPYLKNNGEHYKFLKYLTNIFNNINIIDAGTNFGHSCMALAQNSNNHVITYDIVDRNLLCLRPYKNVTPKCLDINKEENDIIKDAQVILLDIDPHDGIQEARFTARLDDIGYKGYLICDDIFLNDNMSKWWHSIKREKRDLTEVAHFSGTGIIKY